MSVQENFTSPRELELIEYPGSVKNVDKMITTLGGITKLSQALGGEHKSGLELRFHPENPFNKVAKGESSARDGFLLSIKVRRFKNQPEKPPEYRVTILGHCKRIFTFESLCDFQYLPLLPVKQNDKNSPVQELTNGLETVLPKNVTDAKFFNGYEMRLLSMPHWFARMDSVQSGILRADLPEDGQNSVLGVLQKATYDSRDVVAFNMVDNFPTRPDPQRLKRMQVKYVSDEQLTTIQQLFEKCPIWTRCALMYESGISLDKLKCIVPCVAYFFSTGPWRTFYVRYGYDPRKDFGSRYYQSFDFRLRFRSGVAEFVSRRSVTVKKKQENPEELNELAQDIDYPYFEENKLPRARQCILRYIDVRMSKVQEMLDKIPTPATGAVCNEKTGWLPAGFNGDVRQVVSNAIMELLKNHYRKEQIHAEVDSLENEENEEAANELEDTGYDVDEYLNENIQNVFDEMQVENDTI